MNKKKVIRLKSSGNLSKGYRMYVELILPLLNNTRKRSADVFSQLLYFNYLKREIKSDEDRFDIIFSTKYKNMIKENLNISDAVLQNCLTELRKNKLIVDNKISNNYMVYPNSNDEIIVEYNIDLKINEDGK